MSGWSCTVVLSSILILQILSSANASAQSNFLSMDENGNKIHDIMERDDVPGPFDIVIRIDHHPTQEEVRMLAELLGYEPKKFDVELGTSYSELETFTIFNWVAALQVSKEKVFDIAGLPGVEFVELVGPPLIPEITIGLDVAARAVGARNSAEYPSNAESAGLSGSGINICILDTGVDDLVHESLQGKFVAGLNTITNTVGNPDDDQGHGTHVAGIALGTGGPAQTYRGSAPAAGLVDVKVLDANGSGTSFDIIQGIDFCIANNNTYNIRVISISIQTPGYYPDGTDAMSTAVNIAVDQGLVAVVCSGNQGPSFNRITAPGAADRAITVGALNDMNSVTRTDDAEIFFSSRGLRTSDGDASQEDEFKPEITAPGVDIISAQFNSVSGYVSMSGCSMATPLVAGIAALMLQQDPSLTPSQVKTNLKMLAQEMDAIFDLAIDPKYDVTFGSGEAVIIPEFGILVTLVLVTSMGMIIIIAGRTRF